MAGFGGRAARQWLPAANFAPQPQHPTSLMKAPDSQNTKGKPVISRR